MSDTLRPAFCTSLSGSNSAPPARMIGGEMLLPSIPREGDMRPNILLRFVKSAFTPWRVACLAVVFLQSLPPASADDAQQVIEMEQRIGELGIEGRYAEAEQLAEQMVAFAARAFGPRH